MGEGWASAMALQQQKGLDSRGPWDVLLPETPLCVPVRLRKPPVIAKGVVVCEGVRGGSWFTNLDLH